MIGVGQKKHKTVAMDFKRVEGRHPVTSDEMVDFVCTYPVGDRAELATQHPEGVTVLTVRATPSGIQIFGHSPIVRENYELEPLGKIMGLAMREHVRLERDSRETLSVPNQ